MASLKKVTAKAKEGHRRSLAELEAGLSPEAKAILKEIRTIRKSIGKVITDSGDLLYQMYEQDE